MRWSDYCIRRDIGVVHDYFVEMRSGIESRVQAVLPVVALTRGKGVAGDLVRQYDRRGSLEMVHR